MNSKWGAAVGPTDAAAVAPRTESVRDLDTRRPHRRSQRTPVGLDGKYEVPNYGWGPLVWGPLVSACFSPVPKPAGAEKSGSQPGPRKSSTL